jgi:hypothetical protein
MSRLSHGHLEWEKVRLFNYKKEKIQFCRVRRHSSVFYPHRSLWLTQSVQHRLNAAAQRAAAAVVAIGPPLPLLAWAATQSTPNHGSISVPVGLVTTCHILGIITASSQNDWRITSFRRVDHSYYSNRKLVQAHCSAHDLQWFHFHLQAKPPRMSYFVEAVSLSNHASAPLLTI